MPTGASASPVNGGSSLAVLLRTWRERALLTQEQLAVRAGLGVRTIRRLESDDLRHPRLESVRLIADALDLTAAERAKLTGAARSGSALAEQPRELPALPPAFTGRTAERAALERTALERAGDLSTVVITAIDGMAGVGKTALAIHTAHRLADRYPDGQLFIDLHGYTKGLDPVEPGDALDRMLRTLGVAGEQIPAGIDERIGFYRSRLADRQLLIVLDNAATEAQVAPLLPGVAGCLVLVTSRRRLAGLDRTHTISLDVLTLPDAIALFSRTVGEERLADQSPEVVAETVELCGRLPLAIRIAAAWLASHSAWRVADLADRLRDRDQRLIELDDGSRSVAATLDLSYHQLSADQQRMYRLLGLHPGPDFDDYAAAALAGSNIGEARRLCDQLLEAHLLREPARYRYGFHDLVRAHAASTAPPDEAEPARRALTRLLDHYRHTAAVAMDVAHPYEQDSRPRVPPAGTVSPDLPDPAGATAWLDAELPNLLAASRLAATQGWPEHTWHLSATLHRHLHTRGRYHDAETLYHQALTTGHSSAELSALTGLGDVYRMQGQYEQAIDRHRQALAIAQATGHRFGELTALLGLGEVDRVQGQHEQAIAHYQQALEIARTIGHRFGELTALRGLGDIDRLQGRLERANDHYQRTLGIARTIGYRFGELEALRCLGDVDRLNRRYEQAIAHYERALEIARTIGHRFGELIVVRGLGTVHRAQSRHDEAIDHFERALEIARTIGHRTGELSALSGLGTAYRLQGRYEQSSECHRHVLAVSKRIDGRNWQFEALQGLGRLHRDTGHPHAALAHHQQALALATDLRQPIDQARGHDGIAHAYLAMREQLPAREHWQQALDILTSLGVDYTDEEETTVPAIRKHLANLFGASDV